jgi:hypothetical protein
MAKHKADRTVVAAEYFVQGYDTLRRIRGRYLPTIEAAERSAKQLARIHRCKFYITRRQSLSDGDAQYQEVGVCSLDALGRVWLDISMTDGEVLL